MTRYVDDMMSTAHRGMSALFEDVQSVAWVDFPDHANVGDSAIALGLASFLRSQGIRITTVHCIGTLPLRLDELAGDAIVINGGGNIAGHYDKIDQHRNRVFRRIPTDKLVIQAPQSIHFVGDSAKADFEDAVVRRENARFAARDREAASTYAALAPAHRTFLVPDAVHLLGHIPAAAPVKESVWLVRADAESNQTTRPAFALDWPRDDLTRAVTHRVRWRAGKLGPFGRYLNPSPQQWEQLARRRFARGVSLLSEGETIVTDRLHAMLIALQMGRRVIAIDNANRKLSKYAAAWFNDCRPDVTFVDGLKEAQVALARASF